MAELKIENDDQKKVVPSAIYNNLSTIGGLVVFAYKKEAVVVKPSSVRLLSLDAKTSKKRQTVSHIGTGLVEGKLTATVTAGDTIELWDLAKEILISSTSLGGGNDSLLANCTSLGTNNGSAFAATGLSSGEVAFHSINGDLQATPLARVDAHKASITAIGISPTADSPILLASGDTDGKVVLWNRSLSPHMVIPPRQAGDCVTSIVADNKFIIVAYGGGKVRLYSITTGELTVEIAAHARWINAAAIETSAHHLATASDDGTVMVWQLPTEQNPTVKLIGQKFIKNYLWTGLAFRDPGTLCANAYDVDRIYTFSY